MPRGAEPVLRRSALHRLGDVRQNIRAWSRLNHMATVSSFDRITVEPGKCGGKPCIRGMRITVRRVLELLAAYPDRGALLAEYPFLEAEDLHQALNYAAATVDDESFGLDCVA
jgi:uncharacterized protein (DUF433 family)